MCVSLLFFTHMMYTGVRVCSLDARPPLRGRLRWAIEHPPAEKRVKNS